MANLRLSTSRVAVQRFPVLIPRSCPSLAPTCSTFTTAISPTHLGILIVLVASPAPAPSSGLTTTGGAVRVTDTASVAVVVVFVAVSAVAAPVKV